MTIMWEWLRGDLASWLAVGLAVTALFFAIRRRTFHTEVRFSNLHIKDDKIHLELEVSTYSHAYNIDAEAKLKINGINYPVKLEPVNAPDNFRFAVLNIIQLRFAGQYADTDTVPEFADMDVKVKLSDGSKARLRETVTLSAKDSAC